MRDSIKIKTDNGNFKFRVAGLIIDSNKVLVVSMDGASFLALPGGYVELGEKTEEALLRELKEETGSSFKINKYLGVLENYFINKYGIKTHEISFYYLANPVSELSKEDFTILENDKGHIIKLNFKWIKLDEIDNYDIRPAFLKDIIKSGNLEFNHLVLEEVK